MAGAGYKLFVSGDVLTAAQVNTYLNEQTVMVFATSAARTSALSLVLAEGMMSYLQDSNTVFYYDGAAWNALASGDITAITAGTGISVTSGTGPIPTVAIDTAVTVDKTTAQTLTNKTLTSPALTTPTISTLTTNGDLVYGTGSGALSRLGIGSTGNILTVASGLPSWSAPAGGGKVLQVVSAVITTATTIATTTMTDTAITLSITPTLNTSKVLVLINGLVNTTRSINTYGIASNVVRNSTDILTSGYDSYYGEIGSAGAIGFTNKLSYMVLDSPATTSSTTYKLQAQVFQTSSSHSSVWQKNSYPSVITLMEIGA